MKKILSVFLMFAFSLLGVSTIITPASAVDINAGTVVKGEGLSTLYYIGENGKRYVFPNDKAYFSWYDDFSEVLEIPLESLYEYPLGGNIRYKPGNVLLKIQTDPKVYAVGQNGKLHWIKTEKTAKDLYGANWNLLIDDVPDSFFTNYDVDEAIEDADSFDPEEEESEIPTPSYNLGFKNRLQKQIKENIAERRCLRLETFITRVQARLNRFGIEASELGSDYLERCFGDDDDSDDTAKNRWSWHKAGKIDICQNGNTINVSMNAAKAHLARGNTLGACGTIMDNDNDVEDVDENVDENTDEDIDEEESDETAPVISNVLVATSSESATITWGTDEDASAKVYYADSEITETTVTTEVEETGDDTMLHSVELTGLATSTQYFFYVESEDAASNSAESEKADFTTGS